MGSVRIPVLGLSSTNGLGKLRGGADLAVNEHRKRDYRSIFYCSFNILFVRNLWVVQREIHLFSKEQ